MRAHPGPDEKIAPERFARLAEATFGVTATAVPLAGERDTNVRLDVEGRPRYVLKLHAAGGEADRVELQDAVLTWLSGKRAAVPTPRLVETAHVVVAGETRRARLLDWIDGTVWAEASPDDPLRYALGAAVAELDQALADFEHPGLDAPYRWNMLHAADLHASDLHAADLRDGRAPEPPSLRAFVERVEDGLDPLLDRLRAMPGQAIHNDANEHNVLVGADGSIAGILDVGDVVRAPRVCGLAVAAAYAQLGTPDPLAATLPVVRGYHARCPLTSEEIELLADLVDLRLTMSIRNAAEQRRADPDNAYLDVSQPQIGRIVEALADQPRGLRIARYRQACGLEPVESAASVTAWLRGADPAPGSMLRQDLRRAPVAVMDWRPDGPDALRITHGSLAVATEIGRLVERAGATVGIGRYLEHRDVYRSEAFASAHVDGERRTVHLGIDLFVPTGEPVFAPLDATVYAAECRPAPYDYGGVVLLEHETDAGLPFWLLAGHLSFATVAGLRTGQRLRRGERFGYVGTVEENGGWPPHVHVQLFTNLLDGSTDLPGVVRRGELDCWTSICPDPNLLLGIPAVAEERASSVRGGTTTSRRDA